MESPEESKPVVIFEGEIFEATYIKQLLEENEIAAFFENEHMSSIAPWNLTAGGANSLKVIISSLDYDEAIKIIETMDISPAEEEN